MARSSAYVLSKGRHGNLIEPYAGQINLTEHTRNEILRHTRTQPYPSFLRMTTAFLLLIFSINIRAQHLPGKIFVKVKTDSQQSIPLFPQHATDYIYNNFWQTLIKDYHIIQIEKPFKTDDAEVQKVYRISFENYDSIYSFCSRLQQEDYIEYAHPCPVYKTFSTPNDIASRQAWMFQTIQMDNAWGLAGNHISSIAIVDDGIKIDHPDLNIWTNPKDIDSNQIDDDSNGFVDDIHGYDVADQDNNPTPPSSQFWTHGTHTSGIAGAKTNNNLGVASVSDNTATIIAVKCSSQPVALTNAEEGIDYAMAAKANIISMSWGGKDTSLYKTLHTLIDAAHKKDIILIAAAGNDGEDSVNYPAGFENVIAVGSTGVNDIVSKNSNYGNYIDVMAPGDTIYSTLCYSPDYGTLSGTSMSCPMVAAACALMRSVQPNLSAKQVEICLKATADHIDSKNNAKYDNKLGAGRMNVSSAMQCAMHNSVSSFSETDGWNIWPNPSGGIFHISHKAVKKGILTVTDITGKLILYIPFVNQADIDLQAYAVGCYYIQIQHEKGCATQRLLKAEY